MSTIRRNQNAVLGAVKASMQHEDICLHSRSTGEQHAFDLCKQHLQLDRKSWHWLLCRNSRVVESGTEQGCIPGGFQGDSAPKRGCQALTFSLCILQLSPYRMEIIISLLISTTNQLLHVETGHISLQASLVAASRESGWRKYRLQTRDFLSSWLPVTWAAQSPSNLSPSVFWMGLPRYQGNLFFFHCPFPDIVSNFRSVLCCVP